MEGLIDFFLAYFEPLYWVGSMFGGLGACVVGVVFPIGFFFMLLFDEDHRYEVIPAVIFWGVLYGILWVLHYFFG